MTAIIIHKKKEYQIAPGITIQAAMEEINIQPKSVIPIYKGELAKLDMIINEGDTIRLVGVISGG